MLNLTKIILIILCSIFIGILLSPIYIVLKISKGFDVKQITKVYKLWLNQKV